MNHGDMTQATPRGPAKQAKPAAKKASGKAAKKTATPMAKKTKRAPVVRAVATTPKSSKPRKAPWQRLSEQRAAAAPEVPPVGVAELHQIIPVLRAKTATWQAPLMDEMAALNASPYRILIGTLISLRTKDTTTAVVAPRLFALADTPEAMVKLPAELIAKTIYPAGFYRNKAETILAISRILIDQHGGQVPDELDTLLALPGVGRKTANLVLILGFKKPGICVDTHVHRISNRWGFVATATPDETEFALRDKLPRAYWLEYNELLVSFGQNLCHPTSPHCSTCPIQRFCPRIGVTHSR